MKKARRRILISLVILSLLTYCREDDGDNITPACIERIIQAIKRADVQNFPSQVWRWEDATKIYYYITADCCDQFSALYDLECRLICAPDGGLTGGGDGRCPTFGKDLKKTLVWQDPRK